MKKSTTWKRGVGEGKKGELILITWGTCPRIRKWHMGQECFWFPRGHTLTLFQFSFYLSNLSSPISFARHSPPPSTWRFVLSFLRNCSSALFSSQVTAPPWVTSAVSFQSNTHTTSQLDVLSLVLSPELQPRVPSISPPARHLYLRGPQHLKQTAVFPPPVFPYFPLFSASASGNLLPGGLYWIQSWQKKQRN